MPTVIVDVPRCTMTITPDSNGYVPPGTCGYHGKMYYPSFTLGVCFSTIAILIFFGYLLQTFRYRNSGLPRFGLFATTCILCGYVARTVGTRHQQNVPIAAFSDTMIFISPVLITAFNGLVLAKTKSHYGTDVCQCHITASHIFRAVVICCSILFILQIATCAAIITGNPPSVQVAGIYTYLGTLAVQEVLILCLLGITVDYYFIVAKFNKSLQFEKQLPGWRRIFMSLGLSLSAVLSRNLYRLFELPQVFQPESTLPHKEVYFYCFEASPILIALAVWALVPVEHLSSKTYKSGDYKYQGLEDIGSEEEMPCLEGQES